MKLPVEIKRGEPIRADWLNEIVRYLRSITPRESPHIRVHRGAGGATFELRRGTLPGDLFLGELNVHIERPVASAEISKFLISSAGFAAQVVKVKGLRVGGGSCTVTWTRDSGGFHTALTGVVVTTTPRVLDETDWAGERPYWLTNHQIGLRFDSVSDDPEACRDLRFTMLLEGRAG